MATLRVEFLNVQQSNSELFIGPDNVISGFAADAQEPIINGTALSGAGRVTVPAKCDAVRITAIGSDAIVFWGASVDNPVAAAAKGIRLAAGQPEVVSIRPGYLISAMTVA